MASVTAQLVATTAPQKGIAGDLNAPSQAIVKNVGPVDVYWGYTSAVSSTTGFLLQAGLVDTVPLDVGEDLWVITASATAQLYFGRSRALARLV